MYTIFKLVATSYGLKFRFSSNVFEMKHLPNAFESDANSGIP